MDDLISRQQAIDAVKSRKTAEQSSAGIMRNAVVDFCVDIIKKLPSAQPEIIRCKDCKHFIREDIEEHTPYGYNTHFHAFCDKHWDREQGEYIDVNLDDFCSFAERREVTNE